MAEEIMIKDSGISSRRNKAISVIIPTKDRLQDLKRCVGELLPQMSNNDELIIIDNGSLDGTVGFIKGLEKKYHQVRFIFDTTKNLPHLFNIGLESASCEYIGFLNDDTLPSPTWVEDIKKWFELIPEADCIGGATFDQNNRISTNILKGNGMVTRIYDKIVLGGILNEVGVLTDFGGYSVGVQEPSKPIHVTGLTITNMAARAILFSEVGTFNEFFSYSNYDGFFFISLQKHGKKIYLVPGATVKHYPNPGGATRSSYHLSADYAKFYLSLKPSTFKSRIRLFLLCVSYIVLWFILFHKDKEVIRNALKGFKDGFVSFRSFQKTKPGGVYHMK